MKRIVFLLWITIFVFSCNDDDTAPSGPSLIISHNGVQVSELYLSQLKSDLNSREITLYDALHRKEKNYQAFLLADLLRFAYHDSLNTSNNNLNIVFSALDGYMVTASVSLLMEPGGYLAFGDLDLTGNDWENIVPERNNNPAPYYVIWTGENQDPFDNEYPWPYQLRGIDLVD